jgi:hypothetical protein
VAFLALVALLPLGSSLPVTVVGALPFMLLLVAAWHGSFHPRGRVKARGWPQALVLGGWTLWALMAALATLAHVGTEEVLVTFVWGQGLAFLLLLLHWGHPEAPRWDAPFWWALGLGACVPMIAGLIAFHQAFGIPSGPELVMARFDLVRMEPYMAATFGNVGHMGELVALLLPGFLLVALDPDRTPRLRGFSAAMVGLCLLHLAISQSRASILLAVLTFGLALAFHRHRLRGPLGWGALATVLAVALWIGLSTESAFLERLGTAATLQKDLDPSVMERLEAIDISWGLLRQNWLLGVGPGAIRLHNVWTASHQILLDQGVESGVLAALGLATLILGCWTWTLRLLGHGGRDPRHRRTFTFLLGPAMFLLYGVVAGAVLNMTVVNVWIAGMALMVALAAGSSRGEGPELR